MCTHICKYKYTYIYIYVYIYVLDIHVCIAYIYIYTYIYLHTSLVTCHRNHRSVMREIHRVACASQAHDSAENRPTGSPSHGFLRCVQVCQHTHIYIYIHIHILYILREFVLTTVIMVPGACRTQGRSRPG